MHRYSLGVAGLLLALPLTGLAAQAAERQPDRGPRRWAERGHQGP